MSPSTGPGGSEEGVRLAGPEDWATWRDLRPRGLPALRSAFRSEEHKSVHLSTD
jgi:hypothetical protein